MHLYPQLFMSGSLFNSLQLVSIIAKGRYSEIYKYINKDTAKLYVIKKHPVELLGYKKECNVREMEALELIEQHPNIIKYYSYSKDEEYGYFLLEYINGYDLNRIIFESKHEEIEKQVATVSIIKYLLQVLEALKHIHKNKVYHCDVKPENILIYKDSVKLVDFGSAIISQEKIIKVTNEDFVGTPGYLPPEIANHEYKGYVDLEFVDLFGFGSTMYFCFSKTLPFKGNYNSEVNFNVKNLEVKLNIIEEVGIKEILQHIYTKDFNERWDINQVKNNLEEILKKYIDM